MWKDNLTQAVYTTQQRDQMQSNPVYKNLVARLVELPSAPAPLDALYVTAKSVVEIGFSEKENALPHQDSKAEMNENRVDAPTTGKTNRKKG